MAEERVAKGEKALAVSAQTTMSAIAVLDVAGPLFNSRAPLFIHPSTL